MSPDANNVVELFPENEYGPDRGPVSDEQKEANRKAKGELGDILRKLEDLQSLRDKVETTLIEDVEALIQHINNKEYHDEVVVQVKELREKLDEINKKMEGVSKSIETREVRKQRESFEFTVSDVLDVVGRDKLRNIMVHFPDMNAGERQQVFTGLFDHLDEEQSKNLNRVRRKKAFEVFEPFFQTAKQKKALDEAKRAPNDQVRVKLFEAAGLIEDETDRENVLHTLSEISFSDDDNKAFIKTWKDNMALQALDSVEFYEYGAAEQKVLELAAIEAKKGKKKKKYKQTSLKQKFVNLGKGIKNLAVAAGQHVKKEWWAMAPAATLGLVARHAALSTTPDFYAKALELTGDESQSAFLAAGGAAALGTYALAEHGIRALKTRLSVKPDKAFAEVSGLAKDMYVSDQKKGGEWVLAGHISHILQHGGKEGQQTHERHVEVLKVIAKELRKNGEKVEANSEFMKAALLAIDVKDRKRGGQSILSEKYQSLGFIRRTIAEVRDQFYTKKWKDIGVGGSALQWMSGAALHTLHKGLIGGTIAWPMQRPEIFGLFSERLAARFGAAAVPGWLQELATKRGEQKEDKWEIERKRLEKAVSPEAYGKLTLYKATKVSEDQLLDIQREITELNYYISTWSDVSSLSSDGNKLKRAGRKITTNVRKQFQSDLLDVWPRYKTAALGLHQEYERLYEEKRQELIEKQLAKVSKSLSEAGKTKQREKMQEALPEKLKKREKKRNKNIPKKTFDMKLPDEKTPTERLLGNSKVEVADRRKTLVQGLKMGMLAAAFGKAFDMARVHFPHIFDRPPEVIPHGAFAGWDEDPFIDHDRYDQYGNEIFPDDAYPSQGEEASPPAETPQEPTVPKRDRTKEEIRRLAGLGGRSGRVEDIPVQGEDALVTEKDEVAKGTGLDSSKDGSAALIGEPKEPTWEEKIAERGSPAESLSKTEQYMKYLMREEPKKYSKADFKLFQHMQSILEKQNEFVGIRGVQLDSYLRGKGIDMSLPEVREQFEKVVTQHYDTVQTFEKGIMRGNTMNTLEKKMREIMLGSEALSTDTDLSRFTGWFEREVLPLFKKAVHAAEVRKSKAAFPLE